MIPDWVEYTKDAVEVVATLGGMLLGYTRIVYHLGEQNAYMRKIGRGVDYGNVLTEAVAKKSDSVPPGPLQTVRPVVESSMDLSAHLGREKEDGE